MSVFLLSLCENVELGDSWNYQFWGPRVGVLDLSFRPLKPGESWGFFFPKTCGMLTNFVRYMPAAVAMLDREMRYLAASDRWCRDYSLTKDDILGRSHYEVFPDLPERWKEAHQRCLAGETVCSDEELWERAGGGAKWLRWEIRPWGEREGETDGILIFAEDITERKRMEATLREGEATIHALLETAAQAILAVDSRGTVVLANRTTEEMFGYTRDELLGAPLEMLLPERLRERHVAHRSEFTAIPRTRPMGIGLDLQGLRKDGTEFPIEVSLNTVGTSQGTLAVGFVTDITTRKQAETALRNSERELRALARSLLTAQEDERRRVARDLHDDVTQRLALLSIEIGALASKNPVSPEEMRRRLRSFQHQVLQVSQEVRRLSHGLHPTVIEDLGLSAALEEFCEDFAKAQGIPVRFSAAAKDTRLTDGAASCLYRIAQECLQNAAKHAHATAIEVGLTATDSSMQLVIKDDGRGFAAAPENANSGLGLAGMKERIRMAHGTLSIASRPGCGTEIIASIPISGSLV
ncbi:MAG TPA: PAS domain S-box protein [Bryobacteraceae bacterium]|nr:PAS domain S-box protein [Bryobacteraceae bacterium]